MDIAYKRTDKMLGDVEKRLRKEYAKAAKETEQKVKDYYAKYQTKYNAKLKDLKAGKITKQEFLKWNQGQVMIGKRWEEMRDTIATDLTNTNKIAVSAINGHLPEVYALNHNYGTFEVEKGSKVNTSYTLYNRQAVERLVREDPDLLPRPRVDAKKDMRWNKSNFNSGILQGILQGESIDKIARRVALGTSSKDMSIAMRNARTAFTGAQNAGRMDSYRRAADMGIKIMKQWSAALDTHTRDSHRSMDGEEVAYNEEFSNGLMYPGDPSGEPAEVYNCRCAMIADISENLAGIDPDMIDPDLADMSFDEWEDWHLNGGADQYEGNGLNLDNATTFQMARDYFQNQYGIKVADSVADLDYDHVKQAMHGIDDTMKEFPELNGQITEFDTGSGGYYMCTNGSRITFDKSDFAKGASYGSSGAYQAGAHESGHCLDMVICQKEAARENTLLTEAGIKSVARVDWGSNKQARKIVSKAISNTKKANPAYKAYDAGQMRRAMSYYAGTDTAESLAEAVGYEMLLKNRGINAYRVKDVGHAVGSEIFALVKKGVSG